jgi:hypothetical protein
MWRHAMSRSLLTLMLLSFAAMPHAGAAPASVTVAAAPSYIAQLLPAARLAGQGEYRWLMLSIYSAQLWVGAAGYRSESEAAPFLLELRYARDLEGRRIAQASAEQMEHVGAGTAAQRLAWKERMAAIFPDVRRNDTLAGLYTPGQGVSFYLNGAPLTEVLDPAFAQAFFAIWLSPRTSAGALRTALLRDAAPLP